MCQCAKNVSPSEKKCPTLDCNRWPKFIFLIKNPDNVISNQVPVKVPGKVIRNVYFWPFIVIILGVFLKSYIGNAAANEFKKQTISLDIIDFVIENRLQENIL